MSVVPGGGKRKNQKISFLERFLLQKPSSLISSMKNNPAAFHPIRRAALTTGFFTVVVAGWLATPTLRSQAVPTTTSNAALTPILVKLKTQQDQIAANQTKIEAQTAQLKEEIRQVKIFAGRAGSHR